MVAGSALRSAGRARRERSAQLVNRIGLFPLLERLPRRACLIALNYHRIGNPEGYPYDRGVFEATPEQLTSQIEWLKQNFHITSLGESIELIEHPERLRHAQILLTFDDGYRDNHDVAWPILKSLGVTATFFLPTQFIGTHHIPWWDRAADLVRRATRHPIVLDYPRRVELDANPESAILTVLALYKEPSTTDPQRFLTGLEQACLAPVVGTTPERLFMSWPEARAMAESGMSLGSHSHSHEILANQSPAQQLEEVQRSRTKMQTELGSAPDAFAYPVGSAISFTETTRRALSDVGYRVAFSYYGGVNLARSMDRYNVLRIRLARDLHYHHFRLRTLSLAIAGRQLI